MIFLESWGRKGLLRPPLRTDCSCSFWYHSPNARVPRVPRFWHPSTDALLSPPWWAQPHYGSRCHLASPKSAYSVLVCCPGSRPTILATSGWLSNMPSSHLSLSRHQSKPSHTASSDVLSVVLGTLGPRVAQARIVDLTSDVPRLSPLSYPAPLSFLLSVDPSTT